MGARDLNDLLALPADQLKEWVERQSQDEGFNWRGLASAASLRARRNAEQGDGATALAWANVALGAYDRMPDESSRTSAMMLRANMIKLLGPRAGDRLRDPEVIFSWCLDAIGDLKIDEVSTRSQAVRDAIPGAANDPVEQERLANEIRPLRLLKNRLAVPAILAEIPAISLPPQIRDWLAIRSQLP